MVTYTRLERIKLGLCLLTAALTHGCLMSADAEFPEVDVVRSLEFDGVPANAGESMLTKSYDVVYKDLNLPKELRSEFHPSDAVLIAGDGTTDLSLRCTSNCWAVSRHQPLTSERCATSCVGDFDCAAGFLCQGGVCQPKGMTAAPCTAAAAPV